MNKVRRTDQLRQYQVVIQRHAVYTVKAQSQEEAEDLAWDMFSGDDLCEPLVADISEVDYD